MVSPVPAAPVPASPLIFLTPVLSLELSFTFESCLTITLWQLSSSHWILNCTWNSVWNVSPLISSFLSYKIRVIRGRKELTLCSRGRREQGISPVQFSNKTVRAKKQVVATLQAHEASSAQAPSSPHHHSIWPCCLEQNPQLTSPPI